MLAHHKMQHKQRVAQLCTSLLNFSAGSIYDRVAGKRANWWPNKVLGLGTILFELPKIDCQLQTTPSTLAWPLEFLECFQHTVRTGYSSVVKETFPVIYPAIIIALMCWCIYRKDFDNFTQIRVTFTRVDPLNASSIELK